MNRFAFVLLMLLPFSAAAQPHPQPPHPPDDPLARFFYPPDLIMAHGQDIGLQEKQRETVKAEVQKAQSRFFDLQWQVREETDKMVRLLQQSPVDEGKLLEHADRVMSLEREIKRTHLTMLIHLRNMLTPEQQGRLQQFR